jgi:hypothetical protein
MTILAPSIQELQLKWNRWLSATCPREGFIYFRVAFATIWLIYDLLDVSVGGARGFFWSVLDPGVFDRLLACQVFLIICEVGLITGRKTREFAFAAFLARSYQSYMFPLNDFLYYSVAALILSQCDCEGPKSEPARAWPRDVFILQMAWMYFATALLKLSPTFLSGGDLYVRQNYMGANGWPYPQFYRNWVSFLPHDAELAWLGIAGEFTLAILLFSWWYFPKYRTRLKQASTVMALAIHAFGIVFLNVFFFSLSMVVSVVLLLQKGDEKDSPPLFDFLESRNSKRHLASD